MSQIERNDGKLLYFVKDITDRLESIHEKALSL